MTQFAQLKAPNNATYLQPTGLFINNEFVPGQSGATLESINPYDESVIASVAAAGPEDVDAAVHAARRALKANSWAGLSGADRGGLLWKLSELCQRDSHILATIDAWDNGKTYQAAMTEDVAEVVGVFRYYAGWADKIFGRTIETSKDKLAYTKHEPIGVCGQIIPWNFPVMMVAWKLGPALACGNTIVLKASEQTPLSALYMAALIKEAGFPPGVVNIINGLGSIAGKALANHPNIDKIAFTGSTVTGQAIMRAAAGSLKNITLETGGKSPLLVFGDADIDQAIKWSHAGIMGNMGQTCTATSRIYVQESIYDAFLTRFKEFTKASTTMGSQFDENVTHGPQVSKAHLERILAYVEAGKAEGAKLVQGGNATSEKGFFMEPTIFSNVHGNMKIVREEVFGPFVVIQSFTDADDAVIKANESNFGLGASIFTRDLVRAHTIANEIEAGTIWINSSQDSHFGIPFGGYKQSGIGRELGEYALSAYTQVKAIHVNLGNWL